MKAFVSSWVLGVVLVVPTVAVLLAVELINAVPSFPSHRLVRFRRALMVVGVVLLVLVGVAIIARFKYLRT